MNFSEWTDVSKALEYAKRELAPKEKAHGNSWRILKLPDGRENKSRDTMWRKYRSLACALGLEMKNGKTLDDGLKTLQARFDSCGGQNCFLASIKDDINKLYAHEQEEMAKSILGY